jgi:opacity protein-like surface antigen
MKSRAPVFIAFLLLTVMAMPAFAAGPYLGVEGGAVFLSTSTLTFDDGTSEDFKAKTGFGLGVVGGYDFGTYRLEGEFAYRKNNNKESIDNGVTSPLAGDISSMALMVNGYYDFKTVSPTVYPYLGAGIGAARVTVKVPASGGSPDFDQSDTVFAYQFAAGIACAVTKEVTLDLGYKYFATADPELTHDDGSKIKGEYATHNIFLGARISF